MISDRVIEYFWITARLTCLFIGHRKMVISLSAEHPTSLCDRCHKTWHY